MYNDLDCCYGFPNYHWIFYPYILCLAFSFSVVENNSIADLNYFCFTFRPFFDFSQPKVLSIHRAPCLKREWPGSGFPALSSDTPGSPLRYAEYGISIPSLRRPIAEPPIGVLCRISVRRPWVFKPPILSIRSTHVETCRRIAHRRQSSPVWIVPASRRRV